MSLTLPQSSSIAATTKIVDRVEALMRADADIDRWSFYIGSGAVRFYLPMDVQLANEFFAQAVVVGQGRRGARLVQARLDAALKADFDDVIGRVLPLEMGRRSAFRSSTGSAAMTRTVRKFAYDVANAIGTDPSVRDINLDWNEPVKCCGSTSTRMRRGWSGSLESLARAVRTVVSGYTVTQARRDLSDRRGRPLGDRQSARTSPPSADCR